MKHITIVLAASALVLGMASCSSSRNAQNTDDIYYSDGTRKAVASNGSSQGDYYSTAPSDNYVRMKAENYDRWSYFDDYNAADAYYAPAAYGFYPSVGLGYGFGLGIGYGMGVYDPFWAWNSYFLWNSWYNPYFYNPYYGGAVFYGEGGSGVGASYATNLRPFHVMSYRNGLAARGVTTTTSGRFYRQGMTGTSAYNRGLVNQGRPVNNTYYRPNNTGFRNGNNNGFSRPAFNNGGSFRTYTPSSSFGGGGGGGFRSGGGGFRGH